MPTNTMPVHDQLHKRVLFKMAQSLPLATTVAAAAKQYTRNKYILRVLRAPAFVRQQVKEQCAASNSTGQHHLAVTLVLFDHLSSADQALFIDDYARRSVVEVGGARYVGSANVWPYPHTIYPREQP